MISKLFEIKSGKNGPRICTHVQCDYENLGTFLVRHLYPHLDLEEPYRSMTLYEILLECGWTPPEQ